MLHTSSNSLLGKIMSLTDQGGLIQWKSGSAASCEPIGSSSPKQTRRESTAQGLEVGVMLSELWCFFTEGHSVLTLPSGIQTDHSSDSRLTHIPTLRWYWPGDICLSIMVVPKSQDKMFYPPDDMKGDAHVPDFNSYLAMYRKSLENPEGRSSMRSVLVQCLQFLPCIAPPSEPVIQYLCVYLFSLQPVTLNEVSLFFRFLERHCQWILLEAVHNRANDAVQLWCDKREHICQMHGRGQNQHVL